MDREEYAKKVLEEFFDANEYIDEMASGYEALSTQYFEGDYLPLLDSIEDMYKMTDISTIEVPLTVKDMFASEA